MKVLDTKTKTKTILLVDDDPDYLYQQRLLLEVAGYIVVTADSEKAAHAILTEQKPDAAVVDLMMEEMDSGFTLCYEIKRRFPDIPVVLVTGVARETGLSFSASTDEERSWIKADAVLAKPVRFEQLRTELGRLLGS